VFSRADCSISVPISDFRPPARSCRNAPKIFSPIFSGHAPSLLPESAPQLAVFRSHWQSLPGRARFSRPHSDLRGRFSYACQGVFPPAHKRSDSRSALRALFWFFSVDFGSCRRYMVFDSRPARSASVCRQARQGCCFSALCVRVHLLL
jgi:hypothetical protein